MQLQLLQITDHNWIKIIYLPPYLEECVFTLSTEVKPLIIKCDVVTITIDSTHSITHIIGAGELLSAAWAVETHTHTQETRCPH